MSEQWRQISGYEGLYDVSDLGRIRSWHRPEARILSGSAAGNGYRKIRLAKDGEWEDRYIHDVVLTEFVGPRPKRADAAHGNGVRDDNRLTNLRWASRSENHADKRLHGTMCAGETHGRRKLNAEQVKEIRASSLSCRKLSRQFGVGPMQIHRIRTGQNWSATA